MAPLAAGAVQRAPRREQRALARLEDYFGRLADRARDLAVGTPLAPDSPSASAILVVMMMYFAMKMASRKRWATPLWRSASRRRERDRAAVIRAAVRPRAAPSEGWRRRRQRGAGKGAGGARRMASVPRRAQRGQATGEMSFDGELSPGRLGRGVRVIQRQGEQQCAAAAGRPLGSTERRVGAD